MNKYKGELGLLLVALVWGSGFVAVDIALQYISAYQVMSIRFFVASVLLVSIFFNKIKLIDKRILKYGVILGTILYFSFVLQTVGLQHTTVSNNAFLTSVNVVVVPFIGAIIYKMKIEKKVILAAFLATLGVGFLSYQKGLTIGYGDVLTLLCAFSFAFHIFYTSEFARDCDPIALTIVQIVVAFIWSFIFVAFRGEIIPPITSEPIGIYAAIYLGVFSTALAFLLQTVSQKHTSGAKAAIILSLESVIGSILSVVLGRESFTIKLLIGSIIIFIAIIIAETDILKVLSRKKLQ